MGASGSDLREEEGGRPMTAENVLTEEDVLSLVTGGELSRSASLNVLKSYGSRKAIEALQQARNTIPGAIQTIEDIETDKSFTSCVEKLDELIKTTTAVWGQAAE